MNPFEFIHTNVPGTILSVSKVKPESSLFFDLMEIFQICNITEFLSEISKINIANFTLTILYYLIHYNYNGIFKLNIIEYENRLGNLLDAKNTYLTKHKKTILDDTMYKEFQIECLGTTIGFQYKNRLKLAGRIKKGGIIIYRYNPDNKKNSALSLDFKFPNEAGTLITNSNLQFVHF